MTTTMHRLQISLPEWQMEFLQARAGRDGVSLAQVLRQLIEQEALLSATHAGADSLWSIAGIVEDEDPLIAGIAVSERPDLYLAAAVLGEQGAADEPPDHLSLDALG